MPRLLKEGKRQEKEGPVPLYGLLKMGKLGALTRKEPAREERGRTSFTSALARPKRRKRNFIRGPRRFENALLKQQR